MAESVTHDQMAQAIFEEIRDRPYRLAEKQYEVAQNCAVKSNELIQRLAMLGYTLRGRTTGFDWAEMGLPSEILQLYPSEFACTHYYAEILEDGEWRVLDPSFDYKLSGVNGYPFAKWRDTKQPCLTPTRHYEGEELAAYMQLIQTSRYVGNYFSKVSAFAKAANKWFDECRQSYR